MNIAWCVERLYPDLVAGEDYRVVDHSDGHGPQLVWETDRYPIPTEDELARAWIEISKEGKRRELERAARAEIEAVWSGISLGELSPEMAEKKAVLARVQGTAPTAGERTGAGTGRSVLTKLEAKLVEVDAADDPEAVMWDG